MFKTIAMIGLSAALTLPSAAALAQQGTSSSYGTVGWGPVIPTRYQSEDAAEYLRVHGKSPFSFF
jgi:hypothetical protein